MSDSKTRVGVVGLGGISRSEHLPYWRKSPDAEIVAVCDVSRPALEQVGREFGVSRLSTDWKELVAIEDLDVVDVATPNFLHAPVAIAALSAGKHVFCEKPMAIRSSDALAMLEASRRADKILMINHHLRFSPPLVALKQIAVEQGLGEIYHAHAKWTRRRGIPVPTAFHQRAFAGGGPIIDLGVHMLDLALWIMGFPVPATVSAAVGRRLATREDLGGEFGDDWNRDRFEVEDGGVGLVRFDGGATLLLEANWASFQQPLEERTLSVFGTRGGLHYPAGVYCSERDRTPFDVELVHNEEVKPHMRSLLAFLAAVRAGRPSPIPPEESLVVTRVIEAFYRSAEAGREVEVAA